MDLEKFENLKNELENKLESAPANEKSKVILDAINDVFENKYANLINQTLADAKRAESDSEFKKTLGLRNLSKEEETFLTKLKDVKNAVSADQEIILPITTIDVTLDSIRREYPLLNHFSFAPAGVQAWYTASSSGSYVWSKLSAAFDKTKDLVATFEILMLELGKLYVLLIIPKSISDLALPFVDKFLREILGEQLKSGLVYGGLLGNGVEQPIGIYKQIAEVNPDQTHKDKVVNDDFTRFTPKGMASVKKYLTNNGKRTLGNLVLICNPADEADYVAPAMYNDEGKLITSYKNIEVISEPENPLGKAALFVSKKYIMGMKSIGITRYDQTLALEDADLLVGKTYANGRATDDNVAYVFDVTKLEEYIPRVAVSSATDDGTGV